MFPLFWLLNFLEFDYLKQLMWGINECMMNDLFTLDKQTVQIAHGAVLLTGFALKNEAEILAQIEHVISLAPLRNMATPWGRFMSVAMTNCGPLGWVSDTKGYRYEACDPESGKQLPDMPDTLMQLAKNAAEESGYNNFEPDACLINCYVPGTKLSLHQDKDEVDFSAPIVSVSLGLPATFLFGGLNRQDPTQKIPLHHGDVVVFGGQSRLVHHGITPLKKGNHLLLGERRINLTFRKAS